MGLKSKTFLAEATPAKLTDLDGEIEKQGINPSAVVSHAMAACSEGVIVQILYHDRVVPEPGTKPANDAPDADTKPGSSWVDERSADQEESPEERRIG